MDQMMALIMRQLRRSDAQLLLDASVSAEVKSW
jgi:hypothetical protein